MEEVTVVDKVRHSIDGCTVFELYDVFIIQHFFRCVVCGYEFDKPTYVRREIIKLISGNSIQSNNLITMYYDFSTKKYQIYDKISGTFINDE